MKTLLLISTLLFAHLAHAECEHLTPQYISAETASEAEGTPGKRTWFLQKAAKDYAANTSDSCQKSVYEQALKESKAYWDHISKKYNCDSEEDSTKCSDKIKNNVEKNRTYIASVENLTRETVGCVSCGTAGASSPLTKGALKNLGQTQEVLATQVEGKEKDCSHVKISDRRDPEEPLGDIIFSSVPRCISGLWEGFAKDSVQNLLSHLIEAGMEWQQTLSGLKDLFIKLATEPTETLTAITKNIFKYYQERFAKADANWDCFSNKKKMEEICRWVGRAGFDIVPIGLGLKTAVTIAKTVVVGTAKAVSAAGTVVLTTGAKVAKSALEFAKSSAQAGKDALTSSRDFIKAKYAAANDAFVAQQKAAGAKIKEIAQTRIELQSPVKIVSGLEPTIQKTAASFEAAKDIASVEKLHRTLTADINAQIAKAPANSTLLKDLNYQKELIDFDYLRRRADVLHRPIGE